MIHNNLYIFNFKVIKKIFIRSISVICIALIFVFICLGLDYMYVKEDDYARILWHNYYETDEIDNIFVGSSHVYADIDPAILDHVNGMNNFNISAGSMRLNAEYYAIKEVASTHDLKNVYLELYYYLVAGENGNVLSDESVINSWRTIDYTRASINKLFFINSMADSDKYLETVFPFIRYREHLFDISYITSIIREKQTEDYRLFLYKMEDENDVVESREKGYIFNSKQLDDSTSIQSIKAKIQEGDFMSESAEQYLRKIIEYCKSNGINITLFVSPIYPIETLSLGNYDAYNSYISDIACEYSIPFYDFNLCKAEYLDIMNREFFADIGHLNDKGVELFTPFLWEVLSGDAENNKKYFCSSYSEKLLSDEMETFGVYFEESEAEKCYVIASNREEELEYKVEIFLSDDEHSVIQDFSTNKEFLLPNEEHGVMIITTRQSDESEHMQVLEIDF